MRVAIFIDGANLQKAAFEGLAFRLDFRRFLDLLKGEDALVRAYYYVGEFDLETLEQFVRLQDGEPTYERRRAKERMDQDREFHRWLNRNGFKVVAKRVGVFRDAEGGVRVKANVDVELAVDMLTLAPHIDKAVLVSGDGDFVPLVEAVQAQGVRVTVVTTQEAASRGFGSSEALLDAADDFIELADIEAQVTRGKRVSREEEGELVGQTFAGKVAQKDESRGFGFLEDDEQRRYFFHLSALQNLNFDTLREGQKVNFEVGYNNRGRLAALEVWPLGG